MGLEDSLREYAEPPPYPERPPDPIPGSLENGKWFFVYREKKYHISESTYIWGTGSGLSVMDSSHRKESVKDFSALGTRVVRVPNVSPRCEVYQTKKSNIFFLIRSGCFVGECSKEEVLLWLETHGAPMETYERAGIKLESA